VGFDQEFQAEGPAGRRSSTGRRALRRNRLKGEKRSNATHRSTTDPDDRLYRRGPGMEAKLCFISHGLMENRCGLIVDAPLTRVSGHAERLAALDMIEPIAARPRSVDQERRPDAPHQTAACRRSIVPSPLRRPPTTWASPQAARGGDVSGPAECQLIGRWRIRPICRDRAYLDLAGPAYIQIADNG
jgi:hypothetical protein